MPDELAILPNALAVLRARLFDDVEIGSIGQALRALQRLGLTREDLQVHIERLRAVNDATAQSDRVEANCLAALDIVSGCSGDESLRWDSAERARLLLPRVLDREAVASAIEPALERSDLLPPRQLKVPIRSLQKELIDQVLRSLSTAELEPKRADFYRVPKNGFTSRPAALLAPADRICWEALANIAWPLLDDVAPESVVWPRSREQAEFSNFSREPLAWSSGYVVRTDIESFYDSVDHSLLAITLADTLRVSSLFTETLEAFLNSVMSGPVGIPQGPPASEIFASCYLLILDQKLNDAGMVYVRYADDYAIAAESVLDGRRKLELLEGALRDLGLRLNASKTRIMKQSTYRDNTGVEVSPRIAALRQTLRNITTERLRETEDEDELADQLESLGTDEQTMFDLLYHHSVSLDDVIEELRERLNPTLTDTYAAFLRNEAARLRTGDYPENTQDSQADLKESLLYLASARVWVEADLVSRILRWHPMLAPTIAAYIRNVGEESPNNVRPFLARWLTIGSNTDWVQSWACSAAEGMPSLIDRAIRDQLVEVATSHEAGLLTRAGATRALAAARMLDGATWRNVYSESTPAMASELYLDSQADPEGYRGLSGSGPLSILGPPDTDRLAT